MSLTDAQKEAIGAGMAALGRDQRELQRDYDTIKESRPNTAKTYLEEIRKITAHILTLSDLRTSPPLPTESDSNE
jgi:hypothetical protein